jgi:hypothetical protein
VEPARLVLEPDAAAMAEVHIVAPRPLTGATRQQTVRVQASTPQGRHWEATSVFEQAPLLPRRLLLLLGGGLAAAALGIMLLILFMPGDGGGGEPSNPLPGSLLSVSGSIESPGALDNYTFTADKGQRVYLDVRECTST